MNQIRTRDWCITVNNPRDCDWEQARVLFRSGTLMYYVFGNETGESGTPHIQGYLEFKNPRYFNGIKKLWPTAHVEPAKGSSDQASEYCKKTGLFEEQGEKKKMKVGKETICSLSSKEYLHSQMAEIRRQLETLSLGSAETSSNSDSRNRCIDTSIFQWFEKSRSSGSGDQQEPEKQELPGTS